MLSIVCLHARSQALMEQWGSQSRVARVKEHKYGRMQVVPHPNAIAVLHLVIKAPHIWVVQAVQLPKPWTVNRHSSLHDVRDKLQHDSH